MRVRMHNHAGSQQGFTLLAVLLSIAIMGAVSGATAQVWHTAQQREKERELLFAGDQFRQAIRLYYQETPGQEKKYPPSLEALLEDQRKSGKQRYLRRIYRDPMTGNAEWGLVPSPLGGIMGVYSLAEGHPLKLANFSVADREFAGATRYADWAFVYYAGGSSTLRVTGPGGPSAYRAVKP